jgi:hypothetical protein
MKVTAATTLFFATLALASPAPVAQPEAQPNVVESRAQFHRALLARDAVPVCSTRHTESQGRQGRKWKQHRGKRCIRHDYTESRAAAWCAGFGSHGGCETVGLTGIWVGDVTRCYCVGAGQLLAHFLL